MLRLNQFKRPDHHIEAIRWPPIHHIVNATFSHWTF